MYVCVYVFYPFIGIRVSVCIYIYAYYSLPPSLPPSLALELPR